jgi:uncharacterized protein YndB with AHSA1/START domain
MMISNAAGSHTEWIELEFDLAHAPEKVWRALTDPTLLTQWLLPSIGFKAEQGAAFTFNAPPQPAWDGTVHCRMLEIDVPRKLSWSWVAGDIDTIVTFILTPTVAGTHLTIKQSGFKVDQKRNVAGARYGWNMMSARLIDVLDTMETQEAP